MRMTESQAEQYRRDGYLIFPSLFSPAEIAVLRAETARLSAIEDLPDPIGSEVTRLAGIGDRRVQRSDRKIRPLRQHHQRRVGRNRERIEIIEADVRGGGNVKLLVVRAWPQVDDPNKSAVVGKINVAPLPHGPGGKSTPTLGHFIGGIPKNIPKERQVAALGFLRWFQSYDAQVKYAQAGQPPHSGPGG